MPQSWPPLRPTNYINPAISAKLVTCILAMHVIACFYFPLCTLSIQVFHPKTLLIRMAKKFLPKAKLTGDRKKLEKSKKLFHKKDASKRNWKKGKKVLQASSCPYFIGFFEKSPFIVLLFVTTTNATLFSYIFQTFHPYPSLVVGRSQRKMLIDPKFLGYSRTFWVSRKKTTVRIYRQSSIFFILNKRHFWLCNANISISYPSVIYYDQLLGACHMCITTSLWVLVIH